MIDPSNLSAIQGQAKILWPKPYGEIQQANLQPTHSLAICLALVYLIRPLRGKTTQPLKKGLLV